MSFYSPTGDAYDFIACNLFSYNSCARVRARFFVILNIIAGALSAFYGRIVLIFVVLCYASYIKF